MFVQTHEDQLKSKLVSEEFVLELFMVEAYELFLNRADGFRGSLLIQACRALCSYLGLGTERNKTLWTDILTGEVIQELQLISERNPYAACVLGYAYLHGVKKDCEMLGAVVEDKARGIELLKYAADNQIHIAAEPVARAYERGDCGLTKDYIAATDYYIKSYSDKNDYRAKLLVGMPEECTNEEYAWIQEWAQNDDPIAMRTLGIFKLNGHRTALGVTEGMRMLEAAAERDELLAMCFVASACCFGMKFNGGAYRTTVNEMSYLHGSVLANRALKLGWEPARALVDKIDGGRTLSEGGKHGL